MAPPRQILRLIQCEIFMVIEQTSPYFVCEIYHEEVTVPSGLQRRWGPLDFILGNLRSVRVTHADLADYPAMSFFFVC